MNTVTEILNSQQMSDFKEENTMRKFLVISYYDGNIGINVVRDTYEEAKAWMDNDVKDFIAPMELEDVDSSECWIESHSAFANTDGMPCDWVIESIEV